MNDRHGHLRGFQETVDGVQPDAKLEQQGAEGLGGASGRVDHQQEPIGSGGHVGHGSSSHDCRPTAVAVGQLAGTGARRVPDGARRTSDRLQPVARLRKQHQLATVSRLSDEVSNVNTLIILLTVRYYTVLGFVSR